MKVVLLAGGMGTRLAEETSVRPKPMVEIGGMPMLWHIMKLYSHYGFNDFLVCLGYKGYMIKEYFSNYFYHMCDVTFDMNHNTVEVHHKYAEPWKVTLVDTGVETMTGGRLKRIAQFVEDGTFLMTYGDGVGNVDIGGLVAFHKKHGRLATLTAMQPIQRFGALALGPDSSVVAFREKPKSENIWVNGGFFVLEPSVLDRIAGDSTSFEREPLESIAQDGQLGAFKHDGFWYAMDTLRDKLYLEDLWNSGKAPWRVW